MGKRKGRKKKRKQYKYGKNQFIDILCFGCDVCGDYVEPDFCFDYCYKNSPANFINKIFPRLIRLREWPFQSDKMADHRTLKNEVRVFKKTFCNSGCCTSEYENKGQCKYLWECMAKFREQIQDSRDPEERIVSHVPRFVKTKKKRKKKQKQKKVVVQPYPTFVMSGSDAFKARVRRILYGKTNTVKDNEQAGDKELSCGSVAGSVG